MRYVSFVVAIAMLAVVGCTDPYYPSSGYSQSYGYPSSYPANYASYPSGACLAGAEDRQPGCEVGHRYVLEACCV
jgi:hypothetical protein